MKKNDKAYLLDLKIDICAKKDINFQELALFFDKPAFLNLLSELRRTYKVVNLYPINTFKEDFDNHLHNVHYGKSVKTDLTKYSKIKELKKSFPDFYDFLKDENNHMPEVLDAECNLICYEFNRPTYFVESIEQAVFCGAVDDQYFKPTEAQVIDFGEMGAWPTLERVAIFISPTTTYDEVKEEFRKGKALIKTDKRLSYYQPRVDATPNTRKYRHWYWERIKGKTYRKIADEWLEKHQYDTTTELDVLEAVKKYEKLLSA